MHEGNGQQGAASLHEQRRPLEGINLQFADDNTLTACGEGSFQFSDDFTLCDLLTLAAGR